MLKRQHEIERLNKRIAMLENQLKTTHLDYHPQVYREIHETKDKLRQYLIGRRKDQKHY